MKFKTFVIVARVEQPEKCRRDRRGRAAGDTSRQSSTLCHPLAEWLYVCVCVCEGVGVVVADVELKLIANIYKSILL